MDREYKKSYKGFAGLMALFVVMLFALAFIPNADAKVATIVVCNTMSMWMALLTWVIYKTQKIYWYTGLTYEDAKNAGEESRKKYAMSHFKRFAGFAAVFALYSVISCFFKIPLAADITIATIGIVAVALSTINIKLA